MKTIVLQPTLKANVEPLYVALQQIYHSLADAKSGKVSAKALPALRFLGLAG